jgi:hypothetical protein
VAAGYHRLAGKYRDLEAKVKAMEKSCAARVADIEKKMAKEVEDYKFYHLKFRRSLRALHEILVSSLGEIGARCLMFPPKSAPNEDFFSWFEDEVKSLSGVFRQLNDNFVVLAIEGVLNMLRSSGCRDLSALYQLVNSSDASVVEDVPAEVQKLADRLVSRW